ncbi:MAG: transposase [Chloroflexota bacterium]|jgi:transposase
MNERKPYPTDLSDKEWEQIAPLLPSQRTGRPRKYPPREMLNAILYVAHAGNRIGKVPAASPQRVRPISAVSETICALVRRPDFA